MNNYLLRFFNHPEMVTESSLEHDMARLPSWRRQKANTYHFLIDRVLCTEAFLLLQDCLKKNFGITSQIEFDYIKHDKPVLRGCYPKIHFNLSHCKKGAMCVIDDEPIGCDIEEIEEKLDMDVAHYCFNEQECQTIQESENPCVEFTKLWTIKESVLKLTGEGINDSLPSLLTDKLLLQLDIKTVVREDLGYVYSICRFKRGTQA